MYFKLCSAIAIHEHTTTHFFILSEAIPEPIAVLHSSNLCDI